MALDTYNFEKGLLETPVDSQLTSDAATAALQVSTDGCVLHSLIVSSDLGTLQWLQIHDLATTPANGAVPLICIPIPVNGHAVLDFPIALQNGCYVCNSTTHDTKTLGAANCLVIANIAE